MAETGLGQRDAAVRSLELAYQRHDSRLGWIRSEPMFDDLRTDPRVKALILKLGLSEQPATASN